MVVNSTLRLQMSDHALRLLSEVRPPKIIKHHLFSV